MKTENLRINQLSPSAYAWYLGYLAALDAKDVDTYSNYLATECSLQFNNATPSVGRHAVIDGLSRYWATFGDLEHDLLNIYGSDAAFALEALNHYTRADNGDPVTLRAVAFTDRDDDGRVTSVRLYTDTAPLFHSSGDD